MDCSIYCAFRLLVIGASNTNNSNNLKDIENSLYTM